MRRVLASPATQQIEFMCQGVWVNPALFNRVLSVLGSTNPAHSVSVVVNPQLVANNAAADYNAALNVFHFRDEALDTPQDEAFVVHESVHCGFDIDRRANWHWWGQEACAMIAEICYALNRGMPESQISSRDTIRTAALGIARTLRRGDIISWDQYLPLRTAYLEASSDRNSCYHAFGRNTNYINSGV